MTENEPLPALSADRLKKIGINNPSSAVAKGISALAELDLSEDEKNNFSSIQVSNIRRGEIAKLNLAFSIASTLDMPFLRQYGLLYLGLCNSVKGRRAKDIVKMASMPSDPQASGGVRDRIRNFIDSDGGE